MNYQRLRILLILAGVGLLIASLAAGCGMQPGAPKPTPTPSPNQPATPLDGSWQGGGQTQSGRVITVTFQVAAGRIISLGYSYRGLAGLPCSRIDHLSIPVSDQPRIDGDRFSARPGSDLTIQGVFSGTRQASGDITINWQGRLSCSASLQAGWTAHRLPGTPNAGGALEQPARPAGLCGVGVNCLALFGQLLILGLSNGAVLALIATGITLIYSTVRILNLAHGDVFALTTALVTSLVNGFAIQPAWGALPLATSLGLVCLAAVAFSALLSVLIERLAYRPFRQPGQANGGLRSASALPLIATLGLSFILFQAALVWRTFQHSWIPGEHRSVPGLPEVPTDRIPDLLPNFDIFSRLGWRVPLALRFNDLLVIMLALAFAVGVSQYLKHSKGGKALRAYAENPLLAQVIGIDGQRTMRLAFALGGGLAGAAAFIFALYYARPFGDAGAQSGLVAFAAALLGGIGNPLGALISGLLLGVLGAFSDYFINAAWTPVLLLSILIILLALYPGGLGGGAEVEEDAGLSEPADRPAALPADDPAAKLKAESAPVGRGATWLKLAGGAALLLYPLVASASGMGGQVILAGIGIFAILALGLNLPLGLAGALDLGIAASFAMGGYAAAWLAGAWPKIDFSFLLAASAALGGAVGLLKGGLARRLHNNSLAAATLAFGLLAQKVIVIARPLTGGASGIGAIPAPRLLGLTLSDPSAKYYLVLLSLAVAAALSRRLANSRIGRAWLASADDETAAQASGIYTGGYRQLAFVFSGLLAGAAGALQASILGYMDPGAAAFHISVMALAMVILGGVGSVSGVIIGAVLIVSYDKVLIPQFAALLALLWPKGVNIGAVPDLRGASFFNFGIVLYLTVILRSRAATRLSRLFMSFLQKFRF